MSENKAETVEIPEAHVQEEVVVEVENLPQEEKAMAEKHGLVKKEPEGEVKDVKKEQDLQTFEETEKDEKNLVKNYSKGEQALYWKWKHDKKERQTAQAERDQVKIQTKALEKQLAEINGGYEVSKSKLAKVQDLLAGPADDITVEAIQAILKAEPKKADDDNKPLTKKDLVSLKEEKDKELEDAGKKQEFLNTRIKKADELAKTKFDDYEGAVDLAKEVLEGKVKLPKYIDSKKLSADLGGMLSDEKVEYEEIADWIMDTAKLHPNFGKKTETNVKKETKENIERIIDNASKQKSSASLGGGSARRTVSEDDLTIEDAAKLSTEAFGKLSKKTRERLLQS